MIEGGSLLFTTQAFLQLLFKRLLTTSTKSSGFSVGLYSSPIVPTVSLAIGDIQEPGFAGYATQSVFFAYPSLVVDAQGFLCLNCEGAVVFTPANGDAASLIYGWFLEAFDPSIPGSILAGIAPFSFPVPLTDPTTSLTLLPRIGLVSPFIFGHSPVR